MSEAKRKTRTSTQVKARYNQKVYDTISVRVPKEMASAFVRNALTMVLHRHRLSSRRSSSSCSSNGVAVLLQYRLAKSPLLSQILCLYSCHSDHKSTVISIELRRTFLRPKTA